MAWCIDTAAVAACVAGCIIRCSCKGVGAYVVLIVQQQSNVDLFLAAAAASNHLHAQLSRAVVVFHVYAHADMHCRALQETCRQCACKLTLIWQ
jgi:hypothetical protein